MRGEDHNINEVQVYLRKVPGFSKAPKGRNGQLKSRSMVDAKGRQKICDPTFRLSFIIKSKRFESRSLILRISMNEGRVYELSASSDRDIDLRNLNAKLCWDAGISTR